jgi:hypothetical protein
MSVALDSLAALPFVVLLALGWCRAIQALSGKQRGAWTL